MNNYKELLTIVRDKYLAACNVPPDMLYEYLKDNHLLSGICYVIDRYFLEHQRVEEHFKLWRVMKKHYISLYGDLPTRIHWWTTPLKLKSQNMTTLIDKCITPRLTFLNSLIDQL